MAEEMNIMATAMSMNFMNSHVRKNEYEIY
jgi:hypothetical protein